MSSFYPCNFRTGDDLLGARESRKLANNTYLVRRDPDSIAVKLHATDVVIYFRDGTVKLQSGGWMTTTTKDRINRFGPDGFRISSTRRVWNLYGPSFITPYVDGMRFDPLNPEETTEQYRSAADTANVEMLKLGRKIDRVVSSLTPETLASLQSDVRIDLRSVMQRGCPMCKLELSALVRSGRKAVADMPTNHLYDHLTAGNHSPALIIGALVWSGYRPDQMPFVVGMPSIVDRTVKRYLKARMLKAPSLSGSEV